MRDNNYKSRNKQFTRATKEVLDSAILDVPYGNIQPVQAEPLQVKVYNNNFDKALRAFRALVQKERILSSYKEKQSYEKPSQKRRRKHNEMKRKMMELDNPREKVVKIKPYKKVNSSE